MLPYRRRPPAYATKEFRAQQEELESAEERYSGGGPIQRAMEKDLIELRPKFLQLIESLTAAPQRHSSAGDAFQRFKQVFGQAKVALVHTRTLPPRSDRGAYIQLLYSACLSLLKRAFQAEHVVLEHAIYAVFCLYALYETNPLLTEPQSPLQMLTVGLQHPDNPKFLYRRSFKSPIRIDRHHYSLLQRLHDEALARQSDCQCARMKVWQSRGAAHEDEAFNWTCTCGVYMDIVQVIDRLLPNLDFAETTGPSGLDALVGHADYPWGCERPKNKKANRKETTFINVSQRKDVRLSNNELDAIAEVVEQAFDFLESNLDDNLQQYRSSLKQVRLASSNMSASNQAARVRDALKPIFDQSTETTETDAGIAGGGEESEQPPQSALEDDTTIVPAQSVVQAVQGEASLAPPRQEDNTADTVVKNALKDLNCELVLPLDLSETLRNGIEAALNAAIESGDINIERKPDYLGESNRDKNIPQRGPLDDEDVNSRARETNTIGDMFGSNFLASSTYKEARDIDEESDSSDLLSIASDDSTTVGRMTLHTLLAAAGEDDIMQPIHRKRKRMKRARQSSSAEAAAQRQPRKPQLAKSLSRSAAPLREDLLYTSSDDDNSAYEGVGRASLQALLSAVRNKDDGEPISRQEAQGRSSCAISQQNSQQRGHKRYIARDDGKSESPKESDSDIDDSLGRASLDALLSAVDKDGGQNKRPHKAPKKRKTVISGRQGYRGKKRHRKPVIQYTDPPSMSSDESVESINVGRVSLESLLAAVLVDDGGQNRQNTFS